MSPAKKLGPILVAIVLLVLLAVLLLGHRGPRLVIISSHSDDIKYEFREAFADWSEKNLGERVTIEWLDPGGSVSQQRFVLDRFESNPDGIDVDVFFGGGVDPFILFKSKGYLATVDLPAEIVDSIPQQQSGMVMYDEDMQWFGACMSGFGIVYNDYVLEQQGQKQPETWEDLAAPELFSWVSAADPRNSGSMHMAYEIIMQALGWEDGWSALARITANCESMKPSAGDVIAAIEANEVAAGLAIDYYALGLEAQKPSAGFNLPQGVTVINPDGIGVLKGAPNMDYAQAFVRFVMSEDGQKLWILKAGAPGGPKQSSLFRMPMIPQFADRFPEDQVARSLDPYEFTIDFVFDSQKKNARWAILNDLFGAYFVDTHDEMAQAWREVMELPEDDARRRELLAPPMTEQELMDLIPKWGDPRFQTDTILNWKEDAADRYERIAGGQ